MLILFVMQKFHYYKEGTVKNWKTNLKKTGYFMEEV